MQRNRGHFRTIVRPTGVLKRTGNSAEECIVRHITCSGYRLPYRDMVHEFSLFVVRVHSRAFCLTEWWLAVGGARERMAGDRDSPIRNTSTHKASFDSALSITLNIISVLHVNIVHGANQPPSSCPHRFSSATRLGLREHYCVETLPKSSRT